MKNLTTIETQPYWDYPHDETTNHKSCLIDVYGNKTIGYMPMVSSDCESFSYTIKTAFKTIKEARSRAVVFIDTNEYRKYS